MKRQQKPTWRQVCRDIWWVFPIIALCLWATWAQAATVYQPQRFVTPDYDSVHVYTFVNNGSGTFVQIDSSTCVIPCDTTVVLNDTANWNIKSVWYSGGDSAVGGQDVIYQPQVTASVSLVGTGGNTVVVYAVAGSDTISGVEYTVKNGSGVVEAVQTSTASGIDTVQLSAGTWEFIVKKPGYVGISAESTITTDDTLKFSLTADGTIAAPSSPALANVYGYLKDFGGNPLEGANVTISLSYKGKLAVDTTAAKNIISSIYSHGSYPVDSTGLFLFQVLRSSNYSNRDSVFYNLSADYNGQKVFDAIKIYVPDTGNVNLGDTLGARP